MSSASTSWQRITRTPSNSDAGALGQLGGQTALAHAADAADERALGPVVGQGAAQLAQFALAPHEMARQGQAVDVDQVLAGKMSGSWKPTAAWSASTSTMLLGALIEGGDAPIVARPLFKLPEGDARGLHGRGEAVAAGQGGVEGAGQVDAGAVEDGELHGDHGRNVRLQHAGGHAAEGVAVAGLRGLAAGKHGQAQVGRLLQMRAQILRCRPTAPGHLPFQGQIAAAVARLLLVLTVDAVAGVMHHVGLEAFERLADGVERGVVQIVGADLPGPFGLVQRFLDGA